MPAMRLWNWVNTLGGTVWKYRESRRRVTFQPNPLFSQLAKLLMFQLTNKIAHPIPSYNAAAPRKIIVKFTRRSVRNTFYSNRGKLARKKARDLPDLDLESNANIFISESLTPYKKNYLVM